jgi:hypothetical protein
MIALKMENIGTASACITPYFLIDLSDRSDWTDTPLDKEKKNKVK